MYTPLSVSDSRKRIASVSILEDIPAAKISLRLSSTLDEDYVKSLKEYLNNAATQDRADEAKIASLREILLKDTL